MQLIAANDEIKILKKGNQHLNLFPCNKLKITQRLCDFIVSNKFIGVTSEIVKINVDLNKLYIRRIIIENDFNVKYNAIIKKIN